MIRRDGGPAFPEPYDHEADRSQSWGGMSLRDYFAGQAIPSILISQMEAARVGITFANNEDATIQAATMAYEVADAMIAHRNRPR